MILQNNSPARVFTEVIQESCKIALTPLLYRRAALSRRKNVARERAVAKPRPARRHSAPAQRPAPAGAG
jgi:hypothetical protein